MAAQLILQFPELFVPHGGAVPMGPFGWKPPFFCSTNSETPTFKVTLKLGRTSKSNAQLAGWQGKLCKARLSGPLGIFATKLF